MHVAHDLNVDAAGLRLAVVVSRYHREITESMCAAAVDAFVRCGGDRRNLHIVDAAGSFELTALARALAHSRTRTGRAAVDAIVALGCIITGETTHDQHIASAVANGLTGITVQTGMPVAFGVLTCQSIEQAKARSTDAIGRGGVNKGAEAMLAALQTAATIRAIASSKELR
jgi:6,7-dimethyl-8-ribityllumazine synthase